MKARKHRFLAMALALSLAAGMVFPTGAQAAEIVTDSGEVTSGQGGQKPEEPGTGSDGPGPVCVCELPCTAEEMDEACPVCGAEGAAPESCGLYQPVETEGPTSGQGGQKPEEGSDVPGPVCVCALPCTAEEMDEACPVCGAEGAAPESCGLYQPEETEDGTSGQGGQKPEENGQPETATPSNAVDAAVEQVQALIDALPGAEEITEDNAEEVGAQLTAIDEAKAQLTDDEREQLDFARYTEAVAALEALEGQAGASTPIPTATGLTTYTTTNGLTVTPTNSGETFTLVDTDAPAEDISYADNTLTILSDKALTISGTTTKDKIVIQSGKTANITLNGVSIQWNDGDYDNNSGTCAFEVAGNAICNLTLSGENTLESGSGKAGLQVQGSATLNIMEDSNGRLTVQSKFYGAGIGGSRGGAGGNITINGGTVSARGDRGAGIGGGGGRGTNGDNGGPGGNITINGGTVSARGYISAGIGGGNQNPGGTITINGGIVVATSTNLGAAIGGGGNSMNGGTVGTTFPCGGGGVIKITGGSVTAINTYNKGGVGIGGGKNESGNGGAGGTVIISGGMVMATGSPGIGGGASNSNGTSGTPVNFSTGSDPAGNAFIVASSIDNTTYSDSWSGVIFGGDSNNLNTGKVYGNSIELTTDAEIPNGKTLTLENGKTLTIGSGVILTNRGTIDHTYGTLTNSGTINNYGTIIPSLPDGGTVNVASTTELSFTDANDTPLTSATVTYGSNIKIVATMNEKSQVNTFSTAAVNKVNFYLGGTDGILLGTIDVENGNTAILEMTETVWKTPGAVWTIGDPGNTITADFGGSTIGNLLDSGNSTTLTVTAAPLTAPADPQWDSDTPGKATWGAVENASSYSVQLYKDNSPKGTAVSVESGTTEHPFNFSNPEAGTYTFTVTAIGEGNFSNSPASEKSGALKYVTVTWVNGTTTLKTKVVLSGTAPTYDGPTPTKDDDTNYSYTFTGWTSSEDGSTGNITYTATYSKAYLAPEAGMGFTIDYADEEATAANGYEISLNGRNWSGGPLKITPGGTLYVRKAATTGGDPVSASAETTNTLAARPAKPTGISAVNEQWKDEGGGQIKGVNTDMEYRLSSDTAWTACNGATVDNLAAGIYKVRLKATSSAFAGEEADVEIGSGDERTYTLNVTAPTFDPVTYGYPQPEAKGISISSTGNSDATITGVSLSGAGAGFFTLNKTNGETITAGAEDDTTYTVRPAAGLGVGTYTAKITVTYNGGATATGTVTFTVNKATQAAPGDAPTEESKTYNSVTLKPVAANDKGAAAEYSKDGGSTWQSSPEFTGLSASTKYSFVVRYAATENYEASPNSPVREITTNAAPSTGGSGGGSSSGGSGSSIIVDRPDPTNPDNPTTGQTKPGKPDKGGNLTVNNGDVKSAIEKAKEDAKKNGNTKNGVAVIVPITPAAGQTSFDITLRAETLDLLVREKVQRFEVRIDDILAASFSGDTLKWLDAATNGADLHIRASKVDTAALSWAAKTAIGTRPVYDLSLWYVKGNKETAITDLNGHAVSIRMYYEPAKGENTGSLYAVYVDKAGKVEWLTRSSYDADQKSVIFEAVHFSIYGVGYKTPVPVFTDITGHWAQANIEFVASRGLLSGTGNGLFSPNTGMTRGMFVTALGRLAGIDPNKYQSSRFTDVSATAYYAPYVAWAAENGIVSGTTPTTFAPDTNITREQMAVIMRNYAEKLGYALPKTLEAVTFADNARISSWAQAVVTAMQQAGILAGKDGNRFDPQGTATRAEVAAVLHRFVEIVIDPQTVNGWTTNDSGTRTYRKDLKPAAGWLLDDQKWYWLENGGKPYTGGWKQISGKWYYFYADGSMAANTTIDGYTVGKDGVRQ